MELQQAIDFRDECDELYRVLSRLDEATLDQPTQFKAWTINDVVAHLHFWNVMADMSMTDEKRFLAVLADIIPAFARDGGHMKYTWDWLDGLRGSELVKRWHAYVQEMSARFAEADPKRRLKWAGPDMSVRSSITARQMETWAHGQEVYDTLGEDCRNSDRIKNIAVLGVNTFGWTFANRNEDPPGAAPYLRLSAPSGAVWEWNEPSGDSKIEGDAVEFCQVVTQTRSIGDTSLELTGPAASRWMEIAQCFAGPPEEPPAVGARRKL